MVQTMPANPSLNKPSYQVIIDLVNRCLVKNFQYESTRIAFVEQVSLLQPPTGHQYDLGAIDGRYKADQLSKFALTAGGYFNTLLCVYWRLRLELYAPEVVILGDTSITPDEVVAQLKQRYGIYFDVAEVDIQIYGRRGEDSSYRIVITPMENHLVWLGQLDAKLVKMTDIGLDVLETQLGTPNLFGEPDIAQGLLTPKLEGFLTESLIDS